MTVPLSPLQVTAHAQPRTAQEFDIGLVGDVLLTDSVFEGEAEGGAARLGDLLWSAFAECSLVVANFESPITRIDQAAVDKPYNVKAALQALRAFDTRFVLSLANNHVMDFGAEGLIDTLQAFGDAGVTYVGAGRNLAEARVPAYKSINGQTIAVIGAADPRFQPATAACPGTNPATEDGLVVAIHEARARAQYTIVSIHMGLEYADLPSSSQLRLAAACLGAGAHIVQFHHSHCLSGCARSGPGVALFGTGNYVMPNVTGFDSAKSRRSGAWVARLSSSESAVTGIRLRPVSLGDKGFPRPVDGRLAARELHRVNAIGRRMLNSRWRSAWRARDLLHPGFVLPTLYNYRAMLRKHGPAYVARSLAAGLRSQLAR